MLGAIGVFVIAVVLAFSANGEDDAAVVSDVDAQSDVSQSGDQTEQQAAVPGPDDGEPDPPATDPGDAPPDTQPDQPEPNPAETVQAQAEPELTGFLIPIDGACLSDFEGHLPGAPREYRNGIHEGFDLYGWASCRPIDQGTAVLAAKAGTVIRIDKTYTELTIEQFEEASDPVVATLDPERREFFLDRLRGRQVWIDHGAGVVSRYAHLSAVAAGLEIGDLVRSGEVIGFVGESGQLEAITAPGTDYHLHLEIRVNDDYLGQGLPPLEARALYLTLFDLSPGDSP
ncbi:MAG: peptidoglycan DD-metalloendopeptidase family protein [Chloroflexi bacterium]|nr:peptidoglycan DD-metalloendopeptidase family protein [Chloroflexota bacterium]